MIEWLKEPNNYFGLLFGALIPLIGKLIYFWGSKIYTKIYYSTNNDIDISGYWISKHKSLDNNFDIVELLYIKANKKKSVLLNYQMYYSTLENNFEKFSGKGVISGEKFVSFYSSNTSQNISNGTSNLEIVQKAHYPSFLKGKFFEFENGEILSQDYELYHLNNLSFEQKLHFFFRKKVFENYNIAERFYRNNVQTETIVN